MYLSPNVIVFLFLAIYSPLLLTPLPIGSLM